MRTRAHSYHDVHILVRPVGLLILRVYHNMLVCWEGKGSHNLFLKQGKKDLKKIRLAPAFPLPGTLWPQPFHGSTFPSALFNCPHLGNLPMFTNYTSMNLLYGQAYVQNDMGLEIFAAQSGITRLRTTQMSTSGGHLLNKL